MGRKPASRSPVVPRNPGAGRIAGPRAADLRRGPLAGPIDLKATKIAGPDPDVVDDFPELAAVRDGELDVIEAYLGACLDEVLGSIG